MPYGSKELLCNFTLDLDLFIWQYNTVQKIAYIKYKNIKFAEDNTKST